MCIISENCCWQVSGVDIERKRLQNGPCGTPFLWRRELLSVPLPKVKGNFRLPTSSRTMCRSCNNRSSRWEDRKVPRLEVRNTENMEHQSQVTNSNSSSRSNQQQSEETPQVDPWPKHDYTTISKAMLGNAHILRKVLVLPQSGQNSEVRENTNLKTRVEWIRRENIIDIFCVGLVVYITRMLV